MAFEGIEGLQKLIDDILLQGKTKEEVLEKMEEVFARCEEHGIMLAEGKIQVSRSVRFGGFLIDSSSGEVLITPDPDLLKDIGEFPLPQNLTQLRSFKGLVQQVSYWNPDIAALTRATDRWRTE